MKIVLIDDSSNREEFGFPNSIELEEFKDIFFQLTREDLDSINFENLNIVEGANCVIYHANLLPKTEMVSEIQKKICAGGKIIPSIRISGGIEEGEGKFNKFPRIGSMKKSLFYRSLIRFLKDIREKDDLSMEMMENLTKGKYDSIGSAKVTAKSFEESPVTPTTSTIGESLIMNSKGVLVDYSPLPDEDNELTRLSNIGDGKGKPINGTRRWVNHINDFIGLLRSSAGDVVIGFNVDKVGAAEARNAALYIRLAIDKSKKVAFAPILFYGSGPVIEYIRKFADWSSTDILFCGGSHLIGCVDGRPENPGSYSGLTASTYRREFLRKIKVTPNEETAGNHSIANYWGAYVLGKAICKGSDPETPQKKELKKLLDRVRDEREPLYLYYLVAQGRTDEELSELVNCQESTDLKANKESSDDTDQHLCLKNGRVLFIDDQSDIWNPVVQYLLPNATIDVIGKDLLIKETLESESNVDNFVKVLDDKLQYAKKHTEKPFSAEIMNKLSKYSPLQQYDLIILDLRLRGDSEETEQGANLSGLMMLRALMRINRGLRVIMFTSSNKAWNLGLALEYGAAGYYMKEAPGVVVTSAESNKAATQLVANLDYCFETGYLRTMILEKNCLKEGKLFRDETWKDMFAQIEIGFNMLFTAAKTKDVKDYEYAYIAFEQVFEIIKSLYQNPEDISAYRAVLDITGIYVKEYTDYRNDILHDPAAVSNIEDVLDWIGDLWKVIQNIMTLDKKVNMNGVKKY